MRFNARELSVKLWKKDTKLRPTVIIISYLKTEHLSRSKIILENISGTSVHGFRMPRMMPVDKRGIEKAGYMYNSSTNPTWFPWAL